jgi:hypothetical protein
LASRCSDVRFRFGDIRFHHYVKGLPEQPEVLEIIKREDETKNFGGT